MINNEDSELRRVMMSIHA